MSGAPLVAGVELGGTKCVCILASGPDDVRDTVRLPTTDPETTLGAIERVLAGWRGATALGIASFGPIALDPRAADGGRITATTKPGWSGTEVARRLGRHVAGPCVFQSDVGGAGMGEGRWGAARGLADFAYVTVGTGVGAALIAGGRPVTGLTHAELGHVRPRRRDGDDFPGTCSFHGDCFEGLASGPAVAARAGLSGEALAADDPVWEAVALDLGQLAHLLALTGVPRRIVWGGGVVLGQPGLLARIEAAMDASLRGYAETGALPRPYCVVAWLGERAGPLGAVALAQDAVGTVSAWD